MDELDIFGQLAEDPEISSALTGFRDDLRKQQQDFDRWLMTEGKPLADRAALQRGITETTIRGVKTIIYPNDRREKIAWQDTIEFTLEFSKGHDQATLADYKVVRFNPDSPEDLTCALRCSTKLADTSERRYGLDVQIGLTDWPDIVSAYYDPAGRLPFFSFYGLIPSLLTRVKEQAEEDQRQFGHFRNFQGFQDSVVEGCIRAAQLWLATPGPNLYVAPIYHPASGKPVAGRVTTAWDRDERSVYMFDLEELTLPQDRTEMLMNNIFGSTNDGSIFSFGRHHHNIHREPSWRSVLVEHDQSNPPGFTLKADQRYLNYAVDFGSPGSPDLIGRLPLHVNLDGFKTSILKPDVNPVELQRFMPFSFRLPKEGVELQLGNRRSTPE